MRTTYLVCYIIVQFANCTITFCVLDPIMAILAMVQLVMSWLEEDGDGVIIVLGSFEGQVEGEAGSA